MYYFQKSSDYTHVLSVTLPSSVRFIVQIVIGFNYNSYKMNMDHTEIIRLCTRFASYTAIFSKIYCTDCNKVWLHEVRNEDGLYKKHPIDI